MLHLEVVPIGEPPSGHASYEHGGASAGTIGATQKGLEKHSPVVRSSALADPPVLNPIVHVGAQPPP